jgi:hypothetical protein
MNSAELATAGLVVAFAVVLLVACEAGRQRLNRSQDNN